MKVKRLLAIGLSAILLTGTLAGCSGTAQQGTADLSAETSAETPAKDGAGTESADTGSGEVKTIHFLTAWNEEGPNTRIIKALTDEYNQDSQKVNLEIEVVAQVDLDQKLSVLAASNELPDVFICATASVMQTFVSAGKLLNLEEALTEIGIEDCISENTKAGLVALTGVDTLSGLPTQNNIEGIWYNKTIFEENGFEVPKTVGEMEVIAAKCKELGIQPFACAGKEQWPISRMAGNYINRKAGVDALVKANTGEATFQDEAFVEAFTWLQDIGQKGYLGEGVSTIDADVANDTFLNGKAAMYYTGSWLTSDLNNAEKNKLGENVGFFGFPNVEGGVGEQKDYVQNYGTYYCFSKENYDQATKDWMNYVFSHYGDYAMESEGLISGYKLTKEFEVPYYTQMTLDLLEEAGKPGVWPEYRLDQKSNDLLLSELQLLVLGEITSKQLAEEVDASVKSGLSK